MLTIKEAEVRLWFRGWLMEKQADVNLGDLIAAEAIKLELALTSDDIQISEKFEKQSFPNSMQRSPYSHAVQGMQPPLS